MFRPTKGGGASAWLSAGEATLLRTLVVPVMELLNDPARPAPPAAGRRSRADDIFAELEKQFNETATEPAPEAADGPGARPAAARRLPR